MKKFALAMILFAFSWSTWCSQPSKFYYPADNKNIFYAGRIDLSDPQRPRLSGAGSYFQLKFRGSTCGILMKDSHLFNYHNYLAIVIDEKYQGRIRLQKHQTDYPIAYGLKDTVHTLQVCKATESMIGHIDFLGLFCSEILPLEKNEQRKIEFIGNSITCGSGLDISDVPCDSAEWYDQYNAYLAYAPIVARSLQADWLLSAVSGIGMSRNWNSPGPNMPEIYQNLYLNPDSALLWDASFFLPDLVSICLGTNDFSDGDGSYQRAELDSSKFVNDYIQFLRLIRKRYPRAQICCLSSPVFSGEKGTRLIGYISAVIQYMNNNENDGKVHLFSFSGTYNHGCTGHPDQKEHQQMAAELLPFFKTVMDW